MWLDSINNCKLALNPIVYWLAINLFQGVQVLTVAINDMRTGLGLRESLILQGLMKMLPNQNGLILSHN